MTKSIAKFRSFEGTSNCPYEHAYPYKYRADSNAQNRSANNKCCPSQYTTHRSTRKSSHAIKNINGN